MRGPTIHSDLPGAALSPRQTDRRGPTHPRRSDLSRGGCPQSIETAALPYPGYGRDRGGAPWK